MLQHEYLVASIQPRHCCIALASEVQQKFVFIQFYCSFRDFWQNAALQILKDTWQHMQNIEKVATAGIDFEFLEMHSFREN